MCQAKTFPYQVLQAKIHAQNVEVGWHDEKKIYSQENCLFHSEVSEGLEGFRCKNKPDDKLPEYPMLVVEMVDLIIRGLDHLALIGDTIFFPGEFKPENTTICDNINEIHCFLSDSWRAYKKGHSYGEHIKSAIYNAIFVIELMGYDALAVTEKKIAYNKTRSDHQRETRKNDPQGKSF